MNYQETIKYLYECAPLFQNIGAGAYKEGLENTLRLDEHFGHPHRNFRTIHIAGTNGKGSCSHTLAAILQSAGYKTGLYTSPHLLDFRERIRVNGVPVTEDFVVEFVRREREFFEPLHPSFFELTTAMAFLWFGLQKVDVAVIEVGLGGRLDCTNIITPDLSVITNISFDHVQFLGDTLEKIAGEKAGIIKHGVPVVIGETTPETREVFMERAREVDAPATFAEDEHLLLSATRMADGVAYEAVGLPGLKGELMGLCQDKNTNTLLSAIKRLMELGYKIKEGDIREGFARVTELTGLMGRWQRLGTRPTVVCDTGHNVGGMTYIVEQLKMQQCRELRIVLGMVSDKDVKSVLRMMPQEARYYFTQASVKRALPADRMKAVAEECGLKGEAYPTVEDAVRAAKANVSSGDFIFVGGSTFVVADLLFYYKQNGYFS